MNGLLDMQELYVFITRDKDGTEGVIAMRSHDGWMPMVGADWEKVQTWIPMAQEIADGTNQQVSLIKFSVREDIKVISPNRMSETTSERIGPDPSTLVITINPKEEPEKGTTE